MDEVLLMWADEIVCAEQSVANRLHDYIADNVKNAEEVQPNITVLNIPDKYTWNHPELRDIIIEQYQEVGGK